MLKWRFRQALNLHVYTGHCVTQNNLTIEISSYLNAVYIFDKKFYGVLCALSSSIFPGFNQFFNNMLYINKDNVHHFSHN